jgi:hypothetical protein
MSMIEALLEERRGYVVRGLTARIAAVDAALASYGFAAGPEAPEDDGPVVETATVPEAPEDDGPVVETATVKRGRR